MKTVELPQRVRLQYVEQGDPSGLPMILLHGVSDSWHSFERVLPHLPPAIHAFAVTQRGHGDAERPATGYRTRDALRFAIDHPGRIRGLVLAGSFASYRGNPAATQLWESTISRLADPVDPAFVREFQESTLARAVPRAFLDTIVAESLKLPARVWRAAFEGFLEDDFDGLDRIATSTLILWGDRDAICSRDDQRVLLGAIKGARLVVYEGAGHGLHWEEPERFAADLAAFAAALATAGRV